MKHIDEAIKNVKDDDIVLLMEKIYSMTDVLHQRSLFNLGLFFGDVNLVISEHPDKKDAVIKLLKQYVASLAEDIERAKNESGMRFNEED